MDEYNQETGNFGDTQDAATSSAPQQDDATEASEASSSVNDGSLSALLRRLGDRTSQPVTSISSFMAAIADIDPPFKPRTLHRPWSMSAGKGGFGSVEVHRYVNGRNFDVFNREPKTAVKLRAWNPYPRKTGEYYAVKRMTTFHERGPTKTRESSANPYAQLINEIRILTHPDLRGHPNILYLFGVSYTPSRDGTNLAEPNIVLQEGDCGSLFDFYRQRDFRMNRQALVEVKMSLCFDIACGLEALHRHGVVHCDLKPQNILVRRRLGRERQIQTVNTDCEKSAVAIRAMSGECDFVAILADFGGSVVLLDSIDQGEVKLKAYTPLWCAPECYGGAAISRDQLARVDMYSAGLVFVFILLEGRDIFTTTADQGRTQELDIAMDEDIVTELKLSGVALDIAKDKISELELYPVAYSDVFARILDMALQVDPLDRAEKATDMLKPWKEALDADVHLKNPHEYLDYGNQELFLAFASERHRVTSYFDNPKTCARYVRERGKASVL